MLLIFSRGKLLAWLLLAKAQTYSDTRCVLYGNAVVYVDVILTDFCEVLENKSYIEIGKFDDASRLATSYYRLCLEVSARDRTRPKRKERRRQKRPNDATTLYLPVWVRGFSRPTERWRFHLVGCKKRKKHPEEESLVASGVGNSPRITKWTSSTTTRTVVLLVLAACRRRPAGRGSPGIRDVMVSVLLSSLPSSLPFNLPFLTPIPGWLQRFSLSYDNARISCPRARYWESRAVPVDASSGKLPGHTRWSLPFLPSWRAC